MWHRCLDLATRPNSSTVSIRVLKRQRSEPTSKKRPISSIASRRLCRINRSRQSSSSNASRHDGTTWPTSLAPPKTLVFTKRPKIPITLKPTTVCSLAMTMLSVRSFSLQRVRSELQSSASPTTAANRYKSSDKRWSWPTLRGKSQKNWMHGTPRMLIQRNASKTSSLSPSSLALAATITVGVARSKSAIKAVHTRATSTIVQRCISKAREV